MINSLDTDNLVNLSVEKLDVLNDIITSFDLMINEINSNNTENTNEYLNEIQGHYDKIDKIDLHIKAVLLNLNSDDLLAVEYLLAPTKESQKSALLVISDLNNKSISKVNHLISDIKSQLINIKQKKNIYSNYSTFI